MKKFQVPGKKLTDAEAMKIKGGVVSCRSQCDGDCNESYIDSCSGNNSWEWCRDQALQYCDSHCASICKEPYH